MVIIHYTFRLSIDIMDEITELIITFMMQFIVRVLVEYASRQRIYEVTSVHNSTLQGIHARWRCCTEVSPSGVATPKHATVGSIGFCDELK